MFAITSECSTFILLSLIGFCLSPSEARIGIPVGNTQHQHFKEGLMSFEWAQVGGNFQGGTNNWKESNFHVDISGDGSTLTVGSPLVNAMQGRVRVSRLNPITKE